MSARPEDDRLAALFASLEEVVMETPSAAIPALLGALERLRVVGYARLMSAPVNHIQPESGAENDRWLTIPEVAARLRFTKSYCYQLARRSDLPVLRKGKHLRVRLADLRQWENALCGDGLDRVQMRRASSRG